MILFATLGPIVIVAERGGSGQGDFHPMVVQSGAKALFEGLDVLALWGFHEDGQGLGKEL